MEEVVVGIMAILIGGLFCFRGYLAMRMIIPAWGAFAGFMLGAGLVASFTNETFLASALGWLVGLFVALAFGALSYLYYEVSVLLAMASIGFTLGTGAMVALGVSWSWLIVLVGVAAGVLLAIVAIVGDLPGAILTLLTAGAGATAIVAGILLLVGEIGVDDLTSETTTQTAGDDWWWYAIYLALAIAGIVAQLRTGARQRGSLRNSWEESGGRELRVG
jgi:hypothetical protein